MRMKTYDLKEMTDSRMMMEHRLLPITIWFIYGLMAFLVALIVWAYMGEVDVVVKARGTVRPVEAIGTMTAKSTGKIASVNAARDQLVNKGDLLMTLDDAPFQVQKNALLVEKTQMQSDLTLASRFIEGLSSGKNPFNKTSEEAYYYQFEKYQLDVKVNKASVDLSTDKLSRAQEDLKESEQLLKWLESGQTPAKGALSQAAQKYKQYAIDRDNLKRKLTTAAEQAQTFKDLYDSGSVSKMELETVQRELENAKSALDGFSTNYKNALSDKITTLQGQCYELERSQASNSVSASVGSQINWQTNKVTLEKNLALMEEKLKSIELSIANCKVEATLSGVYNPVSDFAVGDVLPEGTKIGTIVPGTAKAYQAEMAIGNQDVGRVRLGDEVKLKLDALPYKEYGFVKGKIVSISPDATVDATTGQSYYKVVADFDNKPLKSYKGVVKNVKVGMAYEAHVVAEHKKILWVVLEKLQLSL